MTRQSLHLCSSNLTLTYLSFRSDLFFLHRARLAGPFHSWIYYQKCWVYSLQLFMQMRCMHYLYLLRHSSATKSTASIFPHEYRTAKDVWEHIRESDFLFSFILSLADVRQKQTHPSIQDFGPPRRNQH